MAFDFSMVKTGDSAKDLAVGEPEFFDEVEGYVSTLYANASATTLGARRGYPRFGGEGALIAAIREHTKHLGLYKHYVVTNGAKQGLYAAVGAILSIKPGVDTLYHAAPYWPTFPTIARNMGLKFAVDDGGWMTVRVSATPNNPDGRSEAVRTVDVWDAAYADDIYNWDGHAPHHRIGVFSSAKLLGLSHLRVGWVGTDDDYLALSMAEFVEARTSGVSVADQVEVVRRLPSLHGPHRRGLKMSLDTNAFLFRNILGEFVEDVGGRPAVDGAGMFAWFKAKDPAAFERALDKTSIRLVPGLVCGGRTDQWRMSLGRTTDVMQKLLLELRSALLDDERRAAPTAVTK